jgi:transcriptional regulator with XRE-family HTH domain
LINFGERLAEARKKAGLSQEALARKLNMSVASIRKWEQKENDPPLKKLSAIADAVGVAPSYFTASEEDDDGSLTPEEERELHERLNDPEGMYAFRDGLLTEKNNRDKRRLLHALRTLAEMAEKE